MHLEDRSHAMNNPKKKTPPKRGQIKLISLDLDGTLLRQDLTIGPRTMKALHTAHKKGIKIVLNSGRMTPAIMPTAELTGLDVYVISYNGAKAIGLKSDDRPLLFELCLPAAVAHELVLEAKKRRLQLNYYLDELVYTEDQPHLRHHINLYISRTSSPFKFVERIEDHTHRDPHKVLFVIDPPIRQELEDALTPLFSKRTTITRTDPEYLEFLHPEVNKGSGLQGLCKVLGIGMEEVMACGDADNDEAMVLAAGWGVGMKNARERVRATADVFTENDNNNDGVGEAIERWVLG